MKKIAFVAVALMATFTMSFGHSFTTNSEMINSSLAVNQRNSASISFRNASGYTLALKILGQYGGLYRTVVLGPHSSQVVYFSKTATYKLKIKASRNGQTSYHKGGNFSVTCNDYEWTQGEMSFQMSTYGNGLGPSISTKDFENNN